jgi:hypothetical protein
MKNIIVFLFSLLFIQFSDAQFYSTGQDPSKVSWQQINTENFQLIFPEGLYAKANRVANVLEYMYEYTSAGYSLKPRKVSIILHNRSVISNGYVSWAPKRSEWITTPPQEMYAQDWLEQLAIHEFRHVVQISNLEQGLTQLLKIVFGEAIVGAVAGYLPLWFYEGDAVMAETALSSTGRGREPDFDRELRVIELDRGKRFSYDQSCLGSYRYHVPDHYKYGYQIVTYGNLNYAENIWDQALKTTARNPFAISPFYFGLRKSGIRSKKELYHETFDSLNTLWNRLLDTNILTFASNIPVNNNKYYTDYKYIHEQKGGYFAVRSGPDDLTRFIILGDSSEKVLFTPGYYVGTRVDIGKKYICWEEYRTDERWEQQSFSVICMLEKQSLRKSILGDESRWFSPALSPDEDKLVCVNIALNNDCSLIIMQVPDGKVLQEIPLHGYYQLFHPVWISNNELAFIAMDSNGKSIRQLNLLTLETKELFHTGFINIDQLSYADGSLLFSCDLEKVRNIYALKLSDKTVTRLTSSKHGADFPHISDDGEKLFYSDYTLSGYKPVLVAMDSIMEVEYKNIAAFKSPWAEALSAKAPINLQDTEIPENSYPSKPYYKILHGFYIHSWMPFYFDPYQAADLNPAIYPGITLMSQNKLSSLFSVISYYYKEGVHYFEPRIIYEGLYPVFEVNFQVSSITRFHSWPENEPHPTGQSYDKMLTIRTYLPLKFNAGKWHRYFKPELSFSYLHRYYHTEDGPRLGYNYLEGSIITYNLLKQSQRDLQPRFGQILYVAYNSPLKDPDYFSTVLAGSLNQYFPGFARHHGFMLQFAYEKQEEGKSSILYNRISLPRGYDDNLLLKQNIKAAADYIFPICSPDWSIGPLVYIKRLSLTAHADFARIRYNDEYKNTIRTVEEDICSFGLILGGEVHLLRFFMPFNPNLRFSYLPKEKRFDLGFDISLDTSSF